MPQYSGRLISYVSDSGRAVTVYEQSDLHPVTLAIFMAGNVTDQDFPLQGGLEDLYSYISDVKGSV